MGRLAIFFAIGVYAGAVAYDLWSIASAPSPAARAIAEFFAGP